MELKYKIREIEFRDNKEIENIIRTCLIEFDGVKEGCAWSDPDLGRFSEIYNKPDRKYWVAESEEGRILGGVGIGPLVTIATLRYLFTYRKLYKAHEFIDYTGADKKR